MPFTAQEIENIANATLDFHLERGHVESQTIQERPLYDQILKTSREFPGAKEFVTERVKGVYTTTLQGFKDSQTVGYANPANIKTASYVWKLMHSGIEFTMHEMAINGIHFSETNTGAGGSNASEAEQIQLANLLEDKLEDMTEGTERDLDRMFHEDGTTDPDLVPGVPSFVVDDPTDALVVGGIDQLANPWWRNRANLNIAVTSGTPEDQILINTLSKEWRQLRRYGGRPTIALCGETWLDWMEKELRARGVYTQEGWAAKGKIDVSMADLVFKNCMFVYDPTLDDLSKSDYMYWLDISRRSIQLRPLASEWMKRHTPSRPEDKYVFYRALTSMAALTCKRRNANGVYKVVIS